MSNSSASLTLSQPKNSAHFLSYTEWDGMELLNIHMHKEGDFITQEKHYIKMFAA
jgi:hypothetical protein